MASEPERCGVLHQQATLKLYRAARNNFGSAASDVLVCVFGQVRGDATVHQSLHHHVLRPLRAHLAILCDEAECARYGPLLSMATFLWRWRPPQDGSPWNNLISQRGQLGATAMRIAARSDAEEAMMAWGQTAGRGGRMRNTSAAATMETRALLLDRLMSAGLLDDGAGSTGNSTPAPKYNWFVFTRPDHLYLCDHPPLHHFASADISVGDAADANVVSDRHAVVRPQAARAYLGVLWCALQWTVAYGRLYCVAPPRQRWQCNLESTLAACLRQARVRVQRAPFSHLLVATNADRSRWSEGTWLYSQALTPAQARSERPAVRAALEKAGGAPALLGHPEHHWRREAQALLAAMPTPRVLLTHCLRVKIDHEPLQAASLCMARRGPLGGTNGTLEME